MAKIFIHTQGCSANQADSEVMAGTLSSEHELVDSLDEAEVVLFNTCTVKGPTENALRRGILEAESAGKKVVLAGCVPQSATARAEFSSYSQVGTEQLDRVGDAVGASLLGEQVAFLERSDTPRLNTTKVRLNPHVEIVPISQGCLSACTYCKTKHARGALVSTPSGEIVRHISKAVEEGAKEVWLTSQDVSAYGLDIDTNIARLLRAITSIPRDFKLRVGMGNPLFVTDFLQEYLDAFDSPKIYQFLHLPVQAGDDTVLADMKRDYTVSDFTRIVSAFRSRFPDLTLMTDIICGYPTESAEQFEKTLDLVRAVRPDCINISRFWPREGTPAAKLKQLDGAEVKRRSKEMTELYHQVALENNKAWIGWQGEILITERGKNGGFIGRTPTYKQVLIEDAGGKDLMGKMVRVEVYDATSFDLRARLR